MNSEFIANEGNGAAATGVRGALTSRAVEYGLLFVLAATVAYTTLYAWGAHTDIQQSLRCMDSALGIV